MLVPSLDRSHERTELLAPHPMYDLTNSDKLGYPFLPDTLEFRLSNF